MSNHDLICLIVALVGQFIVFITAPLFLVLVTKDYSFRDARIAYRTFYHFLHNAPLSLCKRLLGTCRMSNINNEFSDVPLFEIRVKNILGTWRSYKIYTNGQVAGFSGREVHICNNYLIKFYEDMNQSNNRRIK